MESLLQKIYSNDEFIQMIDDPIIFIPAPMRMSFPLTDL